MFFTLSHSKFDRQLPLSVQLSMAEEKIKLRSDNLAQLHEERELENAVHNQGLYQQIPHGWIVTGHEIPWHNWWEKIKTLLEPEYQRQWRKVVAEVENLLACARDDANRLRGSILRSQINQLEQLVSNRSQSQRTYTASEPFIEARLNENDVSAFPDTGAAANFMSLQYAKDHGLKLD
jgi:hypothetical protein